MIGEDDMECYVKVVKPWHSNSCNFTCAPSEDSDQPAHLRSQIRIFAGAHEDILAPNLSTELPMKIN